MRRDLYEIIEDLREAYDDERAIYGKNLDDMIIDLQANKDFYKDADTKHGLLIKEKARIETELNQIKADLAEAFKDGGEVKTSQGKRNTYPGQIVMFCSAQGPHSPAMVLEVCGFPVGKVGLRVFSKSGTQDKFEFAQYREDGELRIYQDTWRFID